MLVAADTFTQVVANGLRLRLDPANLASTALEVRHGAAALATVQQAVGLTMAHSGGDARRALAHLHQMAVERGCSVEQVAGAVLSEALREHG